LNRTASHDLYITNSTHFNLKDHDWPLLREYQGLSQRQAIKLFESKQCHREESFKIDYHKSEIHKQVKFIGKNNIKTYSIESTPMVKTNEYKMKFPNQLCDIRRFKRRRKIRKQNLLKVYSPTPNVKVLQTNTIDDETIKIMQSRDLEWKSGYIPLAKSYYINSIFHGNDYNIFLKFEDKDSDNSVIIRTPINSYYSELQAKLHFIVRACYGWPSITNYDFTEMPLHQFYDDYFLPDE
jgi:hypothetical protein